MNIAELLGLQPSVEEGLAGLEFAIIDRIGADHPFNETVKRFIYDTLVAVGADEVQGGVTFEQFNQMRDAVDAMANDDAEAGLGFDADKITAKMDEMRSEMGLPPLESKTGPQVDGPFSPINYN